MSAFLDYAVGDDYYDTSVLSVPDQSEASRFTQFMPSTAQQQGMTWWESLAAYGASRAIDNRFRAQPANNAPAGSYAGANGRTYAYNPSGLVGSGGAIGGVPTWALLAAVGVVAFIALK